MFYIFSWIFFPVNTVIGTSAVGFTIGVIVGLFWLEGKGIDIPAIPGWDLVTEYAGQKKDKFCKIVTFKYDGEE